MDHETEGFLEHYALRTREMLTEFRLENTKEILVDRVGELRVDVQVLFRVKSNGGLL
jgi:hypothetical protein